MRIAAVSLVLLAVAALSALDARRAPARQWGVPLVIAVIDGWQSVARHLPGGGCRYTPSCSIYGEVLVRRYGAYRGTYVAARRIWGCSPWGGQGEDWPQ